jgi:hypothetical protein
MNFSRCESYAVSAGKDVAMNNDTMTAQTACKSAKK